MALTRGAQRTVHLCLNSANLEHATAVGEGLNKLKRRTHGTHGMRTGWAYANGK